MIEIRSVRNILSNHGGSLKSKIYIAYPNLLLSFIIYTEYTTQQREMHIGVFSNLAKNIHIET